MSRGLLNEALGRPVTPSVTHLSPPRTPPDAPQLLRGRTLWLWGDTVAKQQFTALRCQLSQRGRDGTLAAQRLLLPGYSTACEPDVRRADCAVGTDTAPPDAHLGILHLDVRTTLFFSFSPVCDDSMISSSATPPSAAA